MENKAEDEITTRWRAAENAKHEAVLEETSQKRRRLGANQDAALATGDSTYTNEDLLEILPNGPGRPGRKGAKAAKPR